MLLDDQTSNQRDYLPTYLGKYAFYIGATHATIPRTKDISVSVTRKKLPNVYKSCPKMISLEKQIILTPIQKLPKNMRDLGKLIFAKGYKKLPKVQKIAQSGHTG